MSTTATVETLTAEVRVLMVGNRQITAGVAAQLDAVRYVDAEPMGRIRLRNSDAWIGRSLTDGTLVRVDHGPERPGDTPVLLGTEEYGVDIRWCACQRRTWSVLRHLDHVFGAWEDDVTWLPVQDAHPDGFRRSDEPCGWMTSASPDEWAKVIHESIEEHASALRLWESWRTMPLIVLASMR